MAGHLLNVPTVCSGHLFGDEKRRLLGLRRATSTDWGPKKKIQPFKCGFADYSSLCLVL